MFICDFNILTVCLLSLASLKVTPFKKFQKYFLLWIQVRTFQGGTSCRESSSLSNIIFSLINTLLCHFEKWPKSIRIWIYLIWIAIIKSSMLLETRIPLIGKKFHVPFKKLLLLMFRLKLSSLYKSSYTKKIKSIIYFN